MVDYAWKRQKQRFVLNAYAIFSILRNFEYETLQTAVAQYNELVK